ncbi:MAG: hypothetical protein J6Y69_03750 [Treponema sp.]|nr:hypothetical protein [Treponema sp.]
MKKKMHLFVILLVSLVSVFAQEEDFFMEEDYSMDVDYPLNPAYEDINLDKENEMIQNLYSEDKKLVDKSIKKAIKDLDEYNPCVLYVLSNVYFEKNKDKAAQIFYIGQLRARIDANLCEDISAREAVSVLNEEFGPLINGYTLKDPRKLKKIVESAIDYVKKHDVNYDRRWINLYGMTAFYDTGDKPTTAPEEKWKEITESTIENYDTTFHDYLKTMEKK